MKVIDLLNTALDELPKKIKMEDKTYTLFIDEDTNYHYYQDDKCKYFMLSISCLEELNEEVEIIEEDKKIENNFQYIYGCDNDKIDANFENIKVTLEDIIKVINEMREDKCNCGQEKDQ